MDRSLNLLEDRDTEPALGISDSLVNARRKSVQYGFVHVDNPDVIGEDLADSLVYKASPLEINYAVVGTIFDRVAEAQAGLISRDRIAPSPGGIPHYM
jgi:hypothetical protein